MAPANPAAAASSLPTLSDSDMESPPGSPLQPQKKDKKKAPPSKFATLDSLQQESSSDDEEGKCTQDNLVCIALIFIIMLDVRFFKSFSYMVLNFKGMFWSIQKCNQTLV